MEIFDIHHHLGSLTGGSLQEEAGWQDRDYNNRVRIMQANGVTMSAILAATGYIQADGIKDTMRSNDRSPPIGSETLSASRWPAGRWSRSTALARWGSWNA